jgi:2-hydroxychromene-2-carboxylate isomerase
MKVIDFYYDFRSLYAYFASQRLEVISSNDVDIVWKPVSIDVLLNLQADREPWAEYVDPLAPAKRAHLVADVGRMAAYWNIPLNRPNPRRPRSKEAMSIATLLSEKGIEHEEFRRKAFASLWQKQQDLGDPEVYSSAAADVDWQTMGSLSDGLEMLTRNTVSAYKQGVYGVPTFVNDEQLYFGADRMDVLASNL